MDGTRPSPFTVVKRDSRRGLMGDGQTVFLFCVIYSGALSLVVFANLFARERRRVPVPPGKQRGLRQDVEPLEIEFKKQA
jgi:hypothetical protein